ncbi:restriction endonuclease subunit S [Shewanella morhuae]|uniref:restriction endonuclease subunit S n=1 Tax=Shewanella morhuae TaxID=365591 RepID=UPI0015E7AFF0|nr:restriction endonuclease subunit S [Shewanella morhuae]
MSANSKLYTVQELVKLGIIEKPLDGNHGGIHPKSSDYVESGIPFVMASDLINGHVDIINCKFISAEQAKMLRKGFAKEDDVLLSHKATIGRTAIVGKLDTEFVVLTPQVTYYRVKDRSRINPKYLKYYFDSLAFQSLFEQWAGGGSTRLYLGITGQMKLPIELPDVSIQNQIVNVVDSLDQKITLNRQINQTLEQMAQTLFKSWFVDFDPVIDNALDAGFFDQDLPIPDELQQRAALRKEQRHALRQARAVAQNSQAAADKEGDAQIGKAPTEQQPMPTSLPKELRQLFPNAFEESELGWVPKGWGNIPLSSFGKIVTGKTPSKTVEGAFGCWNDSNLPFITPTDIDSDTHVVFTSRYLTQEGQATVAKSKIHGGSISVTCIGSQMGKTVITYHDAFTNQQINSLTPSAKTDLAFLFFNLRLRREELLLMGSSGSTMPIMNKSTFSKLNVLAPPSSLRDEFSKHSAAMLNKITANLLAINSLEKLRDTLLPKLISGELRLDDVVAEIAAEAEIA